MGKMKGVVLDFETAGRITIDTLKESRSYLKKELNDFKKGEYLHPEDVAGNIRLIEALTLVIDYYGG